MAMDEVLRLSSKAGAPGEGDQFREVGPVHRVSMAASGRTMNRDPATAGTNSHPGTSSRADRVVMDHGPRTRHQPAPAGPAAEHEVLELLGEIRTATACQDP